eukprot:2985149-Prymnesium_polylepis.1
MGSRPCGDPTPWITSPVNTYVRTHCAAPDASRSQFFGSAWCHRQYEMLPGFHVATTRSPFGRKMASC